MSNREIIALALIVVTNGAQLFGLTLPATEQRSEAERAYAMVEQQLTKRAAQLDRRSERISKLLEKLRACEAGVVP